MLVARGLARMGTYLEKHVVGLPELLVDNVQRLERGRAEVRQGSINTYAGKAGRGGSHRVQEELVLLVDCWLLLFW